MARFGTLPVELPQGVEVKVDANLISFKGPKGENSLELPRGIKVKIEDSKLGFERAKDTKEQRALQGTVKSLAQGMVTGVTEGFTKSLEMVGAGYRAEVRGQDLVLTVGYSHPVIIKAPEKISFGVEKSVINVTGIDKQMVGLTSARIRDVRPPEPYKGKGIKYVDEIVRRKPGKQTAKSE